MTMASIMGERHGALPRPYTSGTFQKRLTDFQELIKELTLQDVEATPEERRQMITENLRFDQFCDSIRSLFGSDIRNQDLKAIYRKISTNPDAKVDWSELFGYFQSENEAEDMAVGEEVNVFTVSARARVGDAAGDRKRRDIVVAMRYISFLDVYVSVSQKGAISTWSNKLRFTGCTEILEAAWFTGVDFLPTIRRMACCTERSICIWDSRAKGKNQQVFMIKPIENSPQCMTWVPYTKSVHEDAVLFGDDQGYINLLVIAAKDLNMKNSKGDKKVTTSVTLDPDKLSYPIKKKKLHDDWVLKIKYFPELRCFASCSPSSTSSFALDEVDKVFPDESVLAAKKDDKYAKRRKKRESEEQRGVGVPKGVNAFEYCAKANILATGGVDKVIRVWHPHIWSRPTGKLLGHLFTIVDICCNEKDQHIISLSTARVIRVWDIHTLTSLQVFTDNEERPGEKRIYCMLFNNKHERLLTGSSVIDAWPLTRAVQDTMQVPQTHDRPISQVVFNKETNQLITVCTESVMRVWEAENGKLVYNVPDAHGSGVEITCISLDKTGYRLATGGFNGSVKVWDFGSGQEIKSKPGKGSDEIDLSILGLQFCEINNTRCLIVLGWNNKLRVFEDSNEMNDMPLLRDFSDCHYVARELSLSSSQGENQFNSRTPLPEIGSPGGSNGSKGSAQITNVFKKDYVLKSHELTCITSLLPGLLISGTSSGSIVLWDIPKIAVEKVVPIPETQPLTEEDGEGERTRRSNTTSDVIRGCNLAKIVVRKVRKLDPAFIKSLTKHIESEDDSDDESHRGKRRSKRHSRASRYSRSTSRASSIQSFIPGMPAGPGGAERNMMEEIIAKVEGEDAVKKEEITPPVIDTSAGKTNAEKPTEDTKPLEEKAEVTINVEQAPDDAEQQAEEDREKKEEIDPQDIDPESMMIVESFDPVLVTCHNDSFIRFWTPEGDLLREITAMTRRQGSAVTAMCTDEDVNIMVTGDHKGYITLWDVGQYLEDPSSENRDLIKQVICWRGHLTKVTMLDYIDATHAIVSGSTDSSVRVWWGNKGRFIGFFGQHRTFNFPSSEETAATPVLPYDINEKPLGPVKSISARQKIKAQQKFEYPLVFDKQRWQPFRRSAYIRHRDEHTRDEPEDKKFFGALIKPRLDNSSLESFTTGTMRTGAVFRALPVYRIITPKKPPTPQFSFPSGDDDSMAIFGGYPTRGAKGGAKAAKDKEDKSKGKGRTPKSTMVSQSTSRANSAATTPQTSRF